MRYPDQKQIKVIYYTDPVCSTCWILDPYLKKLQLKFGDLLDIEYRMGGLIMDCDEVKNSGGCPDFCVATLWKNESTKHNVQLGGEVWKKDPIKSTIPPSLGYYAALRQSKKKAELFLRAIKEKIFLQEKNIGTEEKVVTAAIECGLNLHQFMADWQSSSTRARFNRHLLEKTKWEVKSFPTLIFINHDGEIEYGLCPTKGFKYDEIYDDWERIIGRFSGSDLPEIHQKPELISLLKNESRFSTKDIQIICEYKSEIETLHALENALLDGEIIKEKHESIDFWRYNKTGFNIRKDQYRIKDTTIVGGGVCGRYLSLLLNKTGVNAKVYEKRNQTQDKGIGFLLLKNGIDAMDAVGLKSEVLKKGNSINFLTAIDEDGNTLYSNPLDNCVAMTRHDFFKILEQEEKEGDIQFGKKFTNVLMDNNQKIKGVKFEDGTEVDSDLIIGADGIRSQIRHQLFENHKIEESEEREIVALVHCKDIDLKQDVFLKLMDSEAGKYMGIIPLGEDRYIWFLQFNKNSHPLNDRRPEAIKAYTEQTVSNYPEIFKRLVAETNFNKAFYWVSCRMNLLPRFHHDKLMLAGDAAHPLLPLTSQGANSALQDAAVLASLLSTQQAGEDLEDILAKFYDARSKDIQRYIDKGDFMLRSFLDLRKSKQFNLPLAV